ncbi:LytTR family DNA-binding domain-containing protein [Roseivirga sp. E12]|uniref:LytR/AlgR family response regulator transcription factor n=1 Tax=Roseivirga sp. E12 TaxID=2819237 RepID=UPI001ABC4F7C|nr:LytTR family DNA-binding domain-containing protein [Roseivirga sp. E12]MBO3697159.1 response regulator transcription factor [Roseivirga sp. E12]
MNAVIIDNEPKIREALVKLLEIYCPSVNVLGEADGCVSGKLLIDQLSPELIFLDVEMDDGSGIDLIKSNPQVAGHVVFITAHDKYAIDAFKCSALDFLLKPIDPEDLIKSVDKVRNNKSTLDLKTRIEVLEGHLSKRIEQNKIVLSDSECMHLVDVNEILWCAAEGSYTRFVLMDNEEILVSKNLKSYEEYMNRSSFIRIHHSYLVNVNHIKRFERNEGGYLIMANGATLPVSVRKKDNLMQVLKKWNQQHL